jgi:hypothetical protein
VRKPVYQKHAKTYVPAHPNQQAGETSFEVTRVNYSTAETIERHINRASELRVAKILSMRHMAREKYNN